jgi:integrase
MRRTGRDSNSKRESNSGLTALSITRLREPGRYGDGGGLYLRVAEYILKDGRSARSKNWLFRFERHGRERQMGLGSINTLSLAEARAAARECRKALLEGRDPIEARRKSRHQAKLESARSVTFRQCAESYIKAHSIGWKNAAHAAQWPSTLASYVYPIIGNLPVAAIDTALVLKCVEPIWTEKPETAGRVRGRIETILDWAKARDYRAGDNPARWRGHLQNLLPHRSKLQRTRKHHAALPYTDAPAFMAELRARNDISSRALEFTVLTASRTSETIGAKWSEIDLAEKLWTVPAERIKGGRIHFVPLANRVVELLESLPRVEGCDFVFAGGRNRNAPLSNMAMLELMRGMRPGFVPHGFRSTFRDWAGDRTNYQRETIETALAHAVEDETEAAYRRSTAVDKRRRLMTDWARYCVQPPVKEGDKVTAISSPRGRK